MTVTLKNIPHGVTIQAGDELSFFVPDTIATLITPASLAPGTYTLSAEITINDVTTSTPISLKNRGLALLSPLTQHQPRRYRQ